MTQRPDFCDLVKRSGVIVCVIVFFAMMPGKEAASGEDPGSGEPSQDPAPASVEVRQEAEENQEKAEVNPEVERELERLQRELLQFPKRKRYRYGADGEMTYDANRDGARIGIDPKSKGETSFRAKPFVGIDLSGRRTDLGLEYGWSRTYAAKLETADTLLQDMTFRFQRKLLPKTSLSLNDRFALTRQRSTVIEEKRNTWDQSHRASLAHELTKKIQLVLESDYSRADHPHEEFDQSTNYTYAWSPSAFFQVTQKSRLSTAYRMAWTRTQGDESSDNTTHQVRGSYSLKVTQKSSASFDLGYQIQNPNSAGASTQDQTVASMAYTWQVTPKTNFRLNYSHTFQDSTSDSTTTLIQTGTDTQSDSLGLGLGVRPYRWGSADFSFNGAHTRTKTAGGDGSGSKSRSWSLPFQTSLSLTPLQWLSVTLSYTYTHQLSDEKKINEVRDQAFLVTTNVSFQ